MSTRSERADRFGRSLVALAPELLSYFRRRVQPREDAADLLSECLVVAWRRNEQAPEGAEDFRRWMFGVAANVMRNWGRSGRRRSQLLERLRDLLTHAEEAHTEWIEVRDAIEQLPADQAELIRLVHWEGFTITDAAAVLGVSESTARGRYQRARQRLAADPSLQSLAGGVRFTRR